MLESETTLDSHSGLPKASVVAFAKLKMGKFSSYETLLIPHPSPDSSVSAVDSGLAWHVAVLVKFGGAVGIASAGNKRYRTLVSEKMGVPWTKAEGLWTAARTSSASGRPRTATEDEAVSMLAARISEDQARAAAVEAALESLIAKDAAYQALLTVPGIGPESASALVAGVDIALFSIHDKLASFTGLAPCGRQSGTSVNFASSSKGGNKDLKNLLIFSCNSLVRTKTEFDRYYLGCRERGMRHNKTLKATARRRLKVIFAVMRDTRPCSQA